MKTKFLTFLVFLCFGLVILVAEGFSATAQHKPKPRPISEYQTLGAKADHPACRDSLGKYTNFYDVFPTALLEHDQIGHTWYDFQKNGSMGRMISVTNDGYRHYSWTYSEASYPTPGPRWVDGNCFNPSTGWYTGQQHVSGGGTNKNAGYSNQTHLNDGRAVVIHHRTAGVGSDPSMWSMISIEEVLCSGYWDLLFDIPDTIKDCSSGEEGMWPKGEVFYDEVKDSNYIHVVMTEGLTPYGYPQKGEGGTPPPAPHYLPVMVAYERCRMTSALSYTMICENYVNGATQRYTLTAGLNYSNPPTNVISHFDTSCGVTPVVTVSPAPGSRRVAVAYLRPCCDGSCDYLSDVCWFESMDNGNDWIDGSQWPPTIHAITDFGCDGNERAFNDVSACYDYDDSLHIVYVTTDIDHWEPGYRDPHVARLYHWSKEHGIGLVTSAIWEGTRPDDHSCNIAKVSISAMDPIYHPGGDSVYLFCIWTQFDTTTPPDESDAGYTNGEIYGCGSFDGGYYWGKEWNLTGTRTPGCASGECLSEHWSSLAQNMHNGDLHIQYICDRDAGAAVMGQGQWRDNAVMYLGLEEWPLECIPEGTYKLKDPDQANWYVPPLKVEPGGTRDLTLTILSTGCENLEYSIYSPDPCISGSYAGSIPARDSATHTFTISGSGACADTFIDGTIILTTNQEKKVEYIRVQAVVARDYYECPRAPETVDTLDNGVLKLYVNANSQEWIWDKTLADTTLREVFFQGGTIIATTRDGKTLVGRYMGDNDQHAGARDKLYTEDCDSAAYHPYPQFEPDFWILYTKNIFMHDLEPPEADYKWYWWEESKQVKFFKDTPETPEAYKYIVIKYIKVKRHDPPSWWPEKPVFDGYDDTYVGFAMDIDCPCDTQGTDTKDENARNKARYDATKNIAYQFGWGRPAENPQYNNYMCGIALANGGEPGESEVPYGAYNVKNCTHLYPQAPWGWLEQDLYDLAATPLPAVIEDGPAGPDSLVDRSWVFTARKIDAGDDSLADYSFTLVEVVAPNGLTQLQEYVDTARAIVTRERQLGGLPVICGDINGDFVVELGDCVYLNAYLYRNIPLGTKPKPKCPANRADVNADGFIDLGDYVYLCGAFLYRNIPVGTKPAPKCPGIWYYPYAYNPPPP